MDKAIKVLFFGVFSEDSTNISQANAFEKNGCEVTRHDFRANPGLPEDKGYDLVFYSKCNELGIDAIQKYKGVKCLWYMDPLNGNYSDSFKEKIPHVNFICFALPLPLEQTKLIFGHSVYCHLIEEGFDPDVDDNYPIIVEYQHEISFIGTLYNESRKKYYKEVAFEIIKCSRLDHGKEVRKSIINLNFTDGGTSDRAYKIMAAEGFLLSEPWPGNPFMKDVDYAEFNNVGELKEQIKYYLGHSIEREMIAEAGYHAVQKYSRINWAKRILEIYHKCK